MKIHILGSCSGTEPAPGRHQTAWILETQGRLYQFDAGENCAWTAHNMGLDLLALRVLCISHPHFDHVGGIPHLFWTRQKIRRYYKRTAIADPLPVLTPDPEQLDRLTRVLSDLRPDNVNLFAAQKVADGEIFSDGAIRIEARHNRHLGIPEDGDWRSFSYRITAEGKCIVTSGDIKEVAELDDWLKEGCDLLLMESGHHRPWEAAAHIRKTAGNNVRRLVFFHHGRDYLDRPEETAKLTGLAWGAPAAFADDAATFEI